MYLPSMVTGNEIIHVYNMRPLKRIAIIRKPFNGRWKKWFTCRKPDKYMCFIPWNHIHYFFWNSIILDLISSSYPSLNRVRLSLLGGSKLFNIEAKVIIGIVVSRLQIGNKWEWNENCKIKYNTHTLTILKYMYWVISQIYEN